MTSRRSLIVVVLGILCMAPTVGDVGGCNKEATALDARDFAVARKDQDCKRCAECSIGTARCTRACDAGAPPETAIPATCQPLRHDGEVCLRALHAASCSAYETYVDDARPATPSECEFCKVAPEGPLQGFTIDGSVQDASTTDGGAR